MPMSAMLRPERGASPAVDADVLSTFFQAAADAAMVVNRLQKIVALNPAATKVSGWAERDLTTATCRTFQCRDERGKPTCGEHCLAQRCVESGQPIGPMYLRITRTNGESVACEASFLPLRPGDPRGGTCLMLLKDITLLELLDGNVRQRDEAIAQKNLALRAVSEQLSVAWRASLVDLRTAVDALRGRQRELGDAGSKIIERASRAQQTLEGSFAQIKSRIQSALQAH